MKFSSYSFVRRLKGAPSLLLGTVSARLAYSVLVVGLIAASREESGSYLFAGIAGALATGAMALSALPKGRLLDRLGPRALLGLEVVTCSISLLLALLIYQLSLPAWTFLPLAVIIGLGDPSTVAVAKNTWWRKLRTSKERLSAMALEQTLSGLSYTLGAFSAGLVIASFGAKTSFLIGLATTVIPPLLMLRNSLFLEWKIDRSSSPPWRVGRLLDLGLVYLLFFAVSGTLPVLLLAYAGSSHILPLLLAAIYPGTMIAGLLYGTLDDKKPLRTIDLSLIFGTICLLLAGFAPVSLVLGLSLLLYGFSRGPLPPAVSYLAFERVGEKAGGQATGFLLVSLFIGMALGNALAGAAIDLVGLSLALFLPALLTFLAIFITLLRGGISRVLQGSK